MHDIDRRALIKQLEIESDLERRYLLKNLHAFVKRFWHIVEPGSPFVDGWHIHEICAHLEEVKHFRIPKLIINMPPRHMKSLLCSVFFPAWVWADPEFDSKNFIYAAYGESVAIRDSMKTRDLIESPLYKQLMKPSWTLTDDQNKKMAFKNTRGGERQCVGVGSGLTGKGGDYLFIDDPLNALEAFSTAALERCILWHDTAFTSRYNDAKRHAKLLIMQRLVENDLTGHLLERGGYQKLILQCRYDPDSEVKSDTILKLKDPRTVKGELLWPERFDEEAIKDLEKDLKGHSESQLQQDPRPPKGGLFPPENWVMYEKSPSPILDLVQFWDCAEKPSITSDYSVCATWARTDNGFYLMDLWRDKVDAPTLEVMAMTNFKKWKPSTIVIEDKSHGSALIQYLLRKTTLPILPYSPGGISKELRAISATSVTKARKCHLPVNQPFVKDFIKEHALFPKGKNDDQVDTTSMMTAHFNEMDGTGPSIRSI